MMPAFDAGATLRESLASVLAQSFDGFEVIVVDDGSAKAVAAVAGDLLQDERVRLVRHSRNRGVAAARNTALSLATAPLVAHLDADDVWHPDYLESIVPCFDDPGVGLAYSNAVVVGNPESAIYIHDPGRHPPHGLADFSRGNPIPSTTVTMRTAAVRAVGGYSRWLDAGEDYELFLRLMQAGWRFAYVDRALADYRAAEPGRGLTYDQRRVDRDELRLWLRFAASHPLARLPHRELWRRLVRRSVRHSPALRRLRGWLV